MATDQPSPNPGAPRTGTIPSWALLRLVLACVITLALLPYTWGRTLLIGLLVGRPELPYLVLLAASVVAGALLTYRLSASLPDSRVKRHLGWAVGLSWVAINGLLVCVRTGPLLAWPYVLLVLVPATLWLPWVVWMGYRPLAWRTRLGVLGVLLALLAGSLSLLRVEGLTGSANVNFAWRWHARKKGPPEDRTASGTADLTRTGDRDYPQFLGPVRSGVLRDARIARDWRKTPPRLVWRKAVGEGWGAFAVVGNYAVTQEQRGDEECVVCYRLADGARVWLQADPVRFASSMGGVGPRGTPTVAGGRVYSVGATGLLNCLDGSDGRRLWSVNILEDNHAENVSHGVCASPLAVDDWVIVCPTGAGGPSLAAYRRDDGRPVWRGGTHQASYSSPVLADLGGMRHILLYDSDGVTGHDAANGLPLWHFPWANPEGVHCSQPIPGAGAPGRVFVSCGYGKGCALFEVERCADGSWGTRTLWTRPSRMKTKFTTPVLYRGHAYGLDEGILACLEIEGGKQAWKDGRYGHGQVLLAGDRLVVQAENGDLVLVEPSPEGLRERGRLPALGSKTWNNPALAGRFLVVRNDREAACYELPPAEN